MTDEHYRAAQAISSDRSAYRTLSEGWCTHCQKLVAAVVIYDRQPVLWLVGGRAGSHNEAVEEFERLLLDSQLFLAQAEAADRSDLVELGREGVAESLDLLAAVRENRWPAVDPGRVIPLRDRDPRLGTIETDAACRGCRRVVMVKLELDNSLSVTAC